MSRDQNAEKNLIKKSYLINHWKCDKKQINQMRTARNQNFRLRFGNFCPIRSRLYFGKCFSIRFLPSLLLSKNERIEIYKTTVAPVLYGVLTVTYLSD